MIVGTVIDMTDTKPVIFPFLLTTLQSLTGLKAENLKLNSSSVQRSGISKTHNLVKGAFR